MSVLLSILPDPDHDKNIVAGWPELFSHSGASTAGRGPLRQLYPTLVSGKRSGSGAHCTASASRSAACACPRLCRSPSTSHESR